MKIGPARPAVTLDATCVVDGRTWRLFSVEFDTAEGNYVTYIYAISLEHAAAVVDELKATARLQGQFVEERDVWSGE